MAKHAAVLNRDKTMASPAATTLDAAVLLDIGLQPSVVPPTGIALDNTRTAAGLVDFPAGPEP